MKHSLLIASYVNTSIVDVKYSPGQSCFGVAKYEQSQLDIVLKSYLKNIYILLVWLWLFIMK